MPAAPTLQRPDPGATSRLLVSLLAAVAIELLPAAFDPGAALAQETACTSDADCSDGVACTIDACEPVGETGVLCGDGDGDGRISIVDALSILRFCTGRTSTCVPPACDTDSNGEITVADALHVLFSAAGVDAGMICPDGCYHQDGCESGTRCDLETGVCVEQASSSAPTTTTTTTSTTSTTLAPTTTSTTTSSTTSTTLAPTTTSTTTSSTTSTTLAPTTTSTTTSSTTSTTLAPTTTSTTTSSTTSTTLAPTTTSTTTSSTTSTTLAPTTTSTTTSSTTSTTMSPPTCGDGLCNGEETDASCAADCGCAAIAEPDGSCIEEEAPGSCFCAPGCLEMRDCCADACDTCGVCEMDVCQSDADCDDGDPCTRDTCDVESGECSNDPIGNLTEVIDFESLTPGQHIASVETVSGLGPVGVFGMNANFREGTNAALAFDSACIGGCTGEDIDLGTPNEDFDGPGRGEGGEAGAEFQNVLPQGNVAIIAEDLVDADGDGLVDDPDDQGGGLVRLRLDFAAVGPVAVHEITVIDVEISEMRPLVELFDADGALINSHRLPSTGDNGIATTTFEPTAGVMVMTVTARGSLAIDDIVFKTADCESPAATTRNPRR